MKEKMTAHPLSSLPENVQDGPCPDVGRGAEPAGRGPVPSARPPGLIWTIPAGLAAGTLFIFTPDRFFLLPFLALLFLLPWRDPLTTAVLLLCSVLFVAPTHIPAVRAAVQDMRWAGFVLLFLVGWRRVRVRPLSEGLPPRGVLVVLGLIAAAAAASVSVSLDPIVSAGRLAAFLAMTIGVFLVVSKGIERIEQIERLAVGMLGIAFAIVAVSLMYDVIDGSERGSRLGLRLMGILGNPITLGDMIALLIPLAVWWFLWKDPRMGGVVLCGFLLALVETEARSSMGAAAAGCGFVVIRAMWDRIGASKTRRRLLLVALLAAAGGLVLVSYVLRPETFWVLGGRLEHWTVGTRLILERPWLGYGFGVEDRVFDWARIRLTQGYGALVHSSFLGLALQAGIPAAAVFALTWTVFVLRSAGRAWRGSPALVSTGLIGCALSGTVIMISESWAFAAGSPFAFMFWVLVVALLRHEGIEAGSGEAAR